MAAEILARAPLPPFAANVGSSAVESTTAKSADLKPAGLFARVWNKVAEWFSTMGRDEAKASLSTLYSPESTVEEKVESFHALKGAAGPAFQDRFQISAENDTQTFTLDLERDDPDNFELIRSCVSCDKPYFLEELAADRTGEGLESTLEKDLGRAQYTVSGDVLTGSGKERLVDFNQALQALNCTEGESKAIREICNQSVFGIMMSAAMLSNESGMLPTCPGGGRVSYDIRRENGAIAIEARTYKDIQLDCNEESIAGRREHVRENPEMYTSVDMKIQLVLRESGAVASADLGFFACK